MSLCVCLCVCVLVRVGVCTSVLLCEHERLSASGSMWLGVLCACMVNTALNELVELSETSLSCY